MDNDLSHAANLRFENLDTRLTAVEEQLGIVSAPKEGEEATEETTTVESTPYRSRGRTRATTETEGTE